LHSSKALIFSDSGTTTHSEGWAKELGRDTAETADPDWPKRYSIPYNVVLSNKSDIVDKGGGGLSSRGAVAWRLVGHQSPCGRQ